MPECWMQGYRRRSGLRGNFSKFSQKSVGMQKDKKAMLLSSTNAELSVRSCKLQIMVSDGSWSGLNFESRAIWSPFITSSLKEFLRKMQQFNNFTTKTIGKAIGN